MGGGGEKGGGAETADDSFQYRRTAACGGVNGTSRV